jgi:hypothetical protein
MIRSEPSRTTEARTFDRHRAHLFRRSRRCVYAGGAPPVRKGPHDS